MPASRKKQKARTKSKNNNNHDSRAPESLRSGVPDTVAYRSLANDVDDANNWNAVVDLLCCILDLPDLSTRSGYKKMHKSFPDYYNRLNSVYTAFLSNDRIVGGVVGIYAKMCADSILRDRLFEDRNLLLKIMALLDRPACCHVVLQALSTITDCSGRNLRLEIAKKTPVLLRLLEEQPNDFKASERALAVIAHSVTPEVNDKAPPDPKLLKTLNMPRLLSAILTQLRKPTVSTRFVDHALRFLAISSQHCSAQVITCPGAVDLLVACARSTNLFVRCSGAAGVLRLHTARAEKDDMTLDLKRLVATARKTMPDRLADALISHESMGDMYETVRASRDYQEAMMQVARDRDLLRLGRTLGELILRTEFSIVDGAFQSQDPRTGRFETVDIGLPFKTWLDALPLCAAALRATGETGSDDLADILTLKHLLVTSRVDEAHVLARSALVRSPRVGFFYYVLALGADKAEGLRCAKKGLKCLNLTDYVRFALLYRAAEHAIDLGLVALQEAAEGSRSWDEGVAFVLSAWEDAKTFMEDAPPDARSMKSVIYIYIILTFVVKGSEISPDLRELEDAITQLKIADEFAIHHGRPISKTQMRLSCETLLTRTPAAARAWDADVARLAAHEGSSSLEGAQEKAEDDLAAWLEETTLDDDDDDEDNNKKDPRPEVGRGCRHGYEHQRARVPEVSQSKVGLYRCSWCGAPSAILKKCSGCEKVRYCDTACQKGHWTGGGHRKVCTRNL